jgi:hypothetical protein
VHYVRADLADDAIAALQAQIAERDATIEGLREDADRYRWHEQTQQAFDAIVRERDEAVAKFNEAAAADSAYAAAAFAATAYAAAVFAAFAAADAAQRGAPYADRPARLRRDLRARRPDERHLTRCRKRRIVESSPPHA